MVISFVARRGAEGACLSEEERRVRSLGWGEMEEPG